MRRVSEFDALRGMAAMGVLLFHLRPNEGWTHFGMTGVHLFLVLSGYLITGIVLKHVGQPGFFRAFYARRILRIWPIYYLTLFTLVIIQQRLPNPPSLQGLPYYLTFTQYTWHWPLLQQYLTVPPETVRAFDHSWTLAIEEQFYLLWPLAIALCGRKRVIPMVLAIIGFGMWFKTLGYDTWILFNTFGAFALGGLVAALLEDKARVERYKAAFTTFFLIAGAVGFFYVRWYYTVPVSNWPRSWMVWRDSLQNFGFYTIHFGIVGAVAVNAGSRLLAPLRMRELTYLGEISYGMYLYHLPVYWWMGGNWIQIGEPKMMWIAKIAVTFVVATLSYRYIELPILGLKDRFPYGRKLEPAALAPIVAAAPATSAIRQPRMIHARPHRAEGEPTIPRS